MANTVDLKNVLTPADYDGTVEIYREQPEAVGVFVQVYNAAVYYELADALGVWQPERPLGPFVGMLGRTHGIRLRSAAAGAPARVSAHLVDEDAITGSVPNVDIGPDGSVTPIAVAGVGVYVGQIIEMAGGNPDPTKLVACDGLQYLKTDSTYAKLNTYLQAAGYPYGSDADHYNVPDKRERVAVGAGPNTALGATDGVAVGNRHGTRHQHTKHVHTVGPNGFLVWSAPPNWTLQGGATLPVNSYATDDPADGGSGVATDPLDGPAFVATDFYIVYAT